MNRYRGDLLLFRKETKKKHIGQCKFEDRTTKGTRNNKMRL